MSMLIDLVKQLADGSITTEEAGRRARELTSGKPGKIAGIPSRVFRSTHEVEQEFASLAEYTNRHSYREKERWFGAFLMIHTLLGTGNLAAAVDLARRVAVTRPIPDGAAEIPIAMIDAVLADAEGLPPAVVDQFLAMRRAALGQGEPPNAERAMDVIVECFDREGWEYHADRSENKILIRFNFPFGQTTLVCSVSPDDELAVLALEVVQVEEARVPEISKFLLQHFPSVLTERDGERGTVSLYFTMPNATGLKPQVVRNAVVHVNGAAEQVMMLLARRS